MISQFGQIVLKVDHLKLKLTISRELRVVWDADGATISCVSSSVFDFDSKRPSLLSSSLHIPSHAAADNELKIVLCEGIIGCTTRGGLAWPWLAGLYFPHMSHMSLRGRSVGIIPFMRPQCHVNHGRVCSVCANLSSLQDAEGGQRLFPPDVQRMFVDGTSIIERLVMDRN